MLTAVVICPPYQLNKYQNVGNLGRNLAFLPKKNPKKKAVFPLAFIIDFESFKTI